MSVTLQLWDSFKDSSHVWFMLVSSGPSTVLGAKEVLFGIIGSMFLDNIILS